VLKLHIPAPEDPNTGCFFQHTLVLGNNIVVAHIELRQRPIVTDGISNGFWAYP
jgi:hypothetical protein